MSGVSNSGSAFYFKLKGVGFDMKIIIEIAYGN